MSHIPPPGAEDAVLKLAGEYLAAVQTALGTSHKVGVLKVALLGVLKTARRFGVGTVDQLTVLAAVERLVQGWR